MTRITPLTSNTASPNPQSLSIPHHPPHPSTRFHLLTETSILTSLHHRSRAQHRSQPFLQHLNHVLRLATRLISATEPKEGNVLSLDGPTVGRLVVKLSHAIVSAATTTRWILALKHFVPTLLVQFAAYARLLAITLAIGQSVGISRDVMLGNVEEGEVFGEVLEEANKVVQLSLDSTTVTRRSLGLDNVQSESVSRESPTAREDMTASPALTRAPKRPSGVVEERVTKKVKAVSSVSAMSSVDLKTEGNLDGERTADVIGDAQEDEDRAIKNRGNASKDKPSKEAKASAKASKDKPSKLAKNKRDAMDDIFGSTPVPASKRKSDPNLSSPKAAKKLDKVQPDKPHSGQPEPINPQSSTIKSSAIKSVPDTPTVTRPDEKPEPKSDVKTGKLKTKVKTKTKGKKKRDDIDDIFGF